MTDRLESGSLQKTRGAVAGRGGGSIRLLKSARREDASGSLKKRAARRRVRLSERARGAAARPAL